MLPLPPEMPRFDEAPSPTPTALDWLRGHKATAVALVLVLVASVALAVTAWRAHHLPTTTIVSSGEAALAGPAATTTAPPPSGGGGARSARMRAEFEGATDYLAFIQSAMSRPQEGGKFYALLAWRRCDDGGDDKALTFSHATGEADLAAAPADLGKRCANVKAQYPDLQMLYRTVTELRGGRDALLPEGGRGFVAPATRETAQADVDGAIRSGDRYAIAFALKANARFLDVGAAPADGLQGHAGDVLACKGDGSCKEAVDAAQRCVDAGDCAHEDFRDLLRTPAADAELAAPADAAASETTEIIRVPAGGGSDDRE
ncbi:MAG: hypothetical protein ABJD97_13785 [Betaproteobacteria bacterium]